MKAKRILAALLAAALLPAGGALGEDGNAKTLTVTRLLVPGSGDSSLAYPLLSFSDGDGSAFRINADLFTAAHVGEYLSLLSTLPDSGTGLKMDYTLFPEEDPPAPDGVISVVLSARGRMLRGRPSQVWYPLVYDLTDGSRVSSDDLFTDPSAAREAVEGYLEAHVAEGLSDYLENRQLLPVPMDSFALCERGIIYYYDHEALCFLSGFSGEVLIPYDALEDVLDRSEGSPLSRFPGAGEGIDAEGLFSALSEGRLYGVPARLGEALDGALSRLRTGFDPDGWPGGASYETEDARMRGILIISREGSGAVDGLVLREAGLCGLVPGKTRREDWLSVLGSPDRTRPAGREGSSGPGPGQDDIYERNGFYLFLHAGEDGVLDLVSVTNSQKGLYE